jgi:hypothetical protein
MYLIGARGQQQEDRHYRIFGTIASATASQLVSPIPNGRSYMFFQNTSASATMYFAFGSAIATATISGGIVTGCTIVNGGFGFTAPPIIEFMGGAAYCPLVGLGPSGAGMPGYASPNNFPNNSGYHPAIAHTVLTSGVVTSIVIDDPGSGYVFPPWVDIRNASRDRYGCADPFYGSVPNGFQLGPGQSYVEGATTCHTEQVAVYSSTVGAPFHFAWMA